MTVAVTARPAQTREIWTSEASRMRQPEQWPIPLSSSPKPRTHREVLLPNLILVGWLNDAGNYVIFVQNTETQKLQKVTSEPNKTPSGIKRFPQTQHPRFSK